MYCIMKMFNLIVLIKYFEQDYQVDFHQQLEKKGCMFGENDHLMRICIHNGLDVNWLINADIPDNIKQEHQRIKKLAYLK
jgi:hypothetical protein